MAGFYSRWTKEEDNLLKSQQFSNQELSIKLNRTENAIKNRCFYLKVQKSNTFKSSDIEYIKKYYKKISTDKIAKKLNRSKKSIIEKARILGLSQKQWNKQETQFLIDNYEIYGPKYCIEILKKSKDSIYQKAKSLKLEYGRKYLKFSKEYLEQKYITENLPLEQIAQENKVGSQVIKRALLKNEISIISRKRLLTSIHNKAKYHHNIPFSTWSKIAKSARNRKIDFEISIEYLDLIWSKQNAACIYTGIPLTLSHQAKLTNASLDRIDSSKGYIEGNLQWVLKPIQYMKMNLSHESFVEYCKIIASKF